MDGDYQTKLGFRFLKADASVSNMKRPGDGFLADVAHWARDTNLEWEPGSLRRWEHQRVDS